MRRFRSASFSSFISNSRAFVACFSLSCSFRLAYEVCPAVGRKGFLGTCQFLPGDQISSDAIPDKENVKEIPLTRIPGFCTGEGFVVESSPVDAALASACSTRDIVSTD